MVLTFLEGRSQPTHHKIRIPILCYAKNKAYFKAGEEIKTGDVYSKYDEIKKRYYKTQLLRKWGSNSRREDRPNLFYPIPGPDGSDVYPMLTGEPGEHPSDLHQLEGCWRWGASTMEKALKDGRIEFVKQSDGSWIPYEKVYAPLEGEEKTKKYTTWVEESNDGANVMKELFRTAVFDYPKTPSLLVRFLKMANVEDVDTVLDFFSGSATTAHAVMQFNAEDGGHRKFIMVQIPEACDEKTEAYKAGYKNICEIGKERIRRAGRKIKDEAGLTAQDLDIGFRVLKLHSSNMKDVYYKPEEIAQINLDGFIDNIKPDRTHEDLLFQVMLDLGIPLSAQIKQDGPLFYVDNNYLIACFGQADTALITAIAQRQPYYAVFRDASFVNDSAMVNFEQVFATYSPSTIRRVL